MTIPRVNTSEGGVFLDNTTSSCSSGTTPATTIVPNSVHQLLNHHQQQQVHVDNDVMMMNRTVSLVTSNQSIHSSSMEEGTTATSTMLSSSSASGNEMDYFFYDDCSSNPPSRVCSTESLAQMIVVQQQLHTCSSSELSWKSTGTDDFLVNTPLLVTDPDDMNATDPVPDAAQKLGQIISRSMNRLPSMNSSCNPYSSNHIMVNQERIKRCTAPLIRLCELDTIARTHAEHMSTLDNGLFHMEPQTFVQQFHRPFRRIGENVAVGTSIRDIHTAMMNDSTSDRNNILDRRYTHFGMATVRSKSDHEQFYLCQVFRG